jgi:uracil-DNA glycosylase family protein
MATRTDLDPSIHSLTALSEAEARCTRCPLYKFATQVVPGEGRTRSQLMLVGEQPGDREDLAGKPFVGPAGGVLDRALEEAGIDRKTVFVTNAVKHFKHEMRGKKRLHKRPNWGGLHARRRLTKTRQRLIAKPLGIALACLCEFDDALGDDLGSEVVLIRNSKGRPRQLECDTHDTLGLRIKILAVQIYGNRHQ